MTRHFAISLVKSVIRILACLGGAEAFRDSDPRLSVVFAALAIAEIIGILEEIGE